MYHTAAVPGAYLGEQEEEEGLHGDILGSMQPCTCVPYVCTYLPTQQFAPDKGAAAVESRQRPLP
jgi:hypothetical protein